MGLILETHQFWTGLTIGERPKLLGVHTQSSKPAHRAKQTTRVNICAGGESDRFNHAKSVSNNFQAGNDQEEIHNFQKQVFL